MNKLSVIEAFLNRTKGTKVMVYGPSGVGKTHFALTFPRPFVFDFDGGIITGLDRTLSDFDGEDFTEDSPNTYSRFESCWNKTLRRDDVDTLVVDSLTSMSDHMLKRIMELSGKKDALPQIQHWGALINQLQNMFYSTTTEAGKKNLVFVAHEIAAENKVDDSIRWLPLLAGQKLPGKVGLWFDELYYAAITGPKLQPVFSVYTAGSSTFIAKSRLSSIVKLEVTEPNDWRIIWDKVRKGAEALRKEMNAVPPVAK